jgi:hypothetical protein
MDGIFGAPGPAKRMRRIVRRPMAGLGAISASAAQQYADVMKDCANAKAAKVGYSAVAPGVPGPGTCWLANTVYSDGCAGKAQVATYCAEHNIAGVAPGKVSQRVLEVATTTAGAAGAAAAQAALAASAAQYPWGTYSSSTKLLQQQANAFGAKMVADGKWGSYCRLNDDGKLGAGTCGALRAAGLATPTTCQSYATDCRGTITGGATTTTRRTTTVTQPTRTTTPEVLPVYDEESLLDKLGGATTVIMGSAIAIALGIVGFAIAKKKGLIGKKPRPNRRRRRPRRNPISLSIVDEMKHEGMRAADWSLKRGKGVSAKERGRAWLQQSARLADYHPGRDRSQLERAFKDGWDLRAKHLGYSTAA